VRFEVVRIFLEDVLGFKNGVTDAPGLGIKLS